MSSDLDPAPARQAPAIRQTPAEKALAAAREAVSRHLERAVQIIHELAEFSENDRVRLAAAQDLADRAGLTKTTTLKVEAAEGQHEALNNEAAETVARIRENAKQALKGPADISFAAVVVHEGDDDEEPANSS